MVGIERGHKGDGHLLSDSAGFQVKCACIGVMLGKSAVHSCSRARDSSFTCCSSRELVCTPVESR